MNLTKDFLRLSVNFKEFIEKFLQKSLMIYLRFNDDKKKLMSTISASNNGVIDPNSMKQKNAQDSLEQIDEANDEEEQNGSEEYDIFGNNSSENENSQSEKSNENEKSEEESEDKAEKKGFIIELESLPTIKKSTMKNVKQKSNSESDDGSSESIEKKEGTIKQINLLSNNLNSNLNPEVKISGDLGGKLNKSGVIEEKALRNKII